MPFDPDKYLANKQAANSDFDPDSYLKEKDPANKVLSAMAGFGKGATAGFSEKIVGGVKGLADFLEAKAGMRGDISLKDAYRTQRDALRRANEKLKQDNPKTFKGFEIAGGVAPAVGAGVAGVAGKAATAAGVFGTGALAGQGYSEADFGTPQNVFDTALGGVASLATFGAIKGTAKVGKEIGQALKPVKEKLSNVLKEFAEDRAAKAVIGGGNKKFLTKLAKKKGGISKFGRTMLDEKQTEQVFKDGEVIKETQKNILTAGSTSEKAGERARAKLKDVKQVFNDVYDTIDEKIPESFDTKNVSSKIREYAEKKLKHPNRLNLYKAAIKQADEIEKEGMINLRRAQDLKNGYEGGPVEFGAPPKLLSKDVEKEIDRIFSKEIDETIKLVDSLDPNSTGIFPLFRRAKDLYGDLATADRASRAGKVNELSRRFFSPSDQGLGAASAIMEAKATGGLSIPAASKGLLVGAANKILRERGGSAVAVAADRLSKLLNNNPNKLGPYANMLMRAAREGERSLGNLHQILWRTDDKYRALLSLEGPNATKGLSAKERGN